MTPSFPLVGIRNRLPVINYIGEAQLQARLQVGVCNVDQHAAATKLVVAEPSAQKP